MRNRYGKHVCSTMGHTFRVLRYFDLNYRANDTYGGKGKGKGKAVPLQAWTDTEGSWKSPRFRDNGT